MSQIFSILGLPDTANPSVANVGEAVIYEAMQQILSDHNEELNRAISVFVERTTQLHSFRYKMGVGGYMQRRGRQAAPGARKVTGHWDVAFPLEDFGDALMADDITLAYMRLQDLNLHIDGIIDADYNTNRHEILTALFNNANYDFLDEKLETPTLSVKSLANQDGTLYPPEQGADSPAQENHYLVSGYTVANISDTNDPLKDSVNRLEAHFGSQVGGSEIVEFGGKTFCEKIRTEIDDFEDIDDKHIEQGANANVVVGLPEYLPGKLIGRHKAGIWLVEWSRIPDNYSLATHLGYAPPLVKRVDAEDTGIPEGLHLVAKNEKYPLETSYYRNRYGYGVGNRLNGIVRKYAASGDYEVPTLYQR
ncbi:MAG TPA: hypothetical protein DIW23_07225 [Anaerolineae bacterium]|nr:hypothetical protein [Anaerolineae bacterium]